MTCWPEFGPKQNSTHVKSRLVGVGSADSLKGLCILRYHYCSRNNKSVRILGYGVEETEGVHL